MVYVTRDQVAQVKYLLEQAMQGNHIIFEAGVIRAAVLDPKLQGLSREDLQRGFDVESHIEKIMTLKSIPLKKAYLERLPADVFHAVVLTYVSIVENTIDTAQDIRH